MLDDEVKGGGYGRLQMVGPQFEVLEGDGAQAPTVGGIQPKYHLVQGLTNRKLAQWVAAAMPAAADLEDVIPAEVRERQKLLPISDAVRFGHQPETEDEWREARRRITFEELFELQVGFALMRAQVAHETATAIPYRQEVIDAFQAGVGFGVRP